jgi:hypothetical protein
MESKVRFKVRPEFFFPLMLIFSPLFLFFMFQGFLCGLLRFAMSHA